MDIKYRRGAPLSQYFTDFHGLIRRVSRECYRSPVFKKV